jgi:hypothetical protein
VPNWWLARSEAADSLELRYAMWNFCNNHDNWRLQSMTGRSGQSFSESSGGKPKAIKLPCGEGFITIH